MSLPHIHWFRRVDLPGLEHHIHRYGECRCGARKRLDHRCCQPVVQCWLDGEHWPCKDLKVPPSVQRRSA